MRYIAQAGAGRRLFLGGFMTRNRLRLALVALLPVAALAIGLAHTSVARADSTPSVVQSASLSSNDWRANNSTTVSEAFSSNVSSGDELVVVFQLAGGNVCIPQSNPTDSLSTSFSNEFLTSDGINDGMGIYAGYATSSGADTISLVMQGQCGDTGGTFVQVAMTIVEVSGEASSGLVSGHVVLAESGTGGTTHTASSPGLGTSNSDLDIGAYVDGGANAAISLPAGESQLGSKQDSTVNFEHEQATASAQSSMTFDTSSSAGYAVTGAISIASV